MNASFQHLKDYYEGRAVFRTHPNTGIMLTKSKEVIKSC